MIGGTNDSPYSVSYTDGRGNSWNVNVNRRSYQVPSGSEVDERNTLEDELEPQDEDPVKQQTEEQVDGRNGGQEERKEDNDSDEDESH